MKAKQIGKPAPDNLEYSEFWNLTAGAFLREYLALCKKYRCTIGACGCCESPWLMDHDDPLFEGFNFDEELKNHEIHLRDSFIEFAVRPQR